MSISAIVEPLGGTGYRAIGAGGLSVGLTAEGATADQAIHRLAAMVQSRLDAGATLAQLPIGGEIAPWKADAGALHDSPLYDAWRSAMADYRRQLDADPDAL